MTARSAQADKRWSEVAPTNQSARPLYRIVPEVAFRAERTVPPRLSIVLLDWSCRESFHTLRYLQRQSVPRELYEVIWIEYYRRRAPVIAQSIDEGPPPLVDQWIIIDMPPEVYYHKHLMYNVGILASRGEIVTFCDSDAMMRPTFVASILEEFERDSDIVLHMDQVRNNDRRFYPFNYPSFEEVVGPGAINWTGQTTTGLMDTEDPLHARNYGACMSARRQHLLAIGGADEHIDYVGHICGPYELTFRLVNAGRREIWHPAEFLYHTWHPGQAGAFNYLGPHDGRHMSVTALEARRTGRVLPLAENAAVQRLRLQRDKVEYARLMAQAIPEAELPGWTVAALQRRRSDSGPRELLVDPRLALPLASVSLRIVWKQGVLKMRQLSRRSVSMLEAAGKFMRAYRFLRRETDHISHVIRQSRRCLEDLAAQGIREVALYGATEVAEIIEIVARRYLVRIDGVYDDMRRGRSRVLPSERLAEYDGRVIIASIVDIDRRLDALKRLGLDRSRIVVLQ